MIDWKATEKEFKINKDNYKFSSTVIVVCDNCGVYNHKKIRSKKNVVNGQMQWKCMKCCLDNPNTKIKKSKSSKEIWKKHRDKIINSIDYTKVSKGNKEKWQDVNYKSKVLKSIQQNRPILSKRMKEKWQDADYKSKMMAIYKTTEWQNERSEIAKKAWQDDEYKNKLSKYSFEKRISKEEFLKRANKIYDNKYDYSKIDYKSYYDPIIIICKKHGEFKQIPRNHLKYNGCSSCILTQSHLQNEIYEFVNGLNSEIMSNDRNIIYPYELDIYIKNKSMAIEVNGMYWHSFNHIETTKERNRHTIKCDLCQKKEIQLVQINEYEWRNKKNIVKSILKSKLGISNRIYARKCKIKEVTSKEHFEFMNENHIQGGKGYNVAYGLEHNNKLVAVMSFNKHNKYEWEITRFANKLNTTVVGGASRLFKRFLKEQNPNQILTYADRRYSDGNLYKTLGFKLDGVTKPNYCYIRGINHFSRQQFMKHKLKSKLKKFNSALTEAENMFNNGYRRMWDAGNYRFLWR